MSSSGQDVFAKRFKALASELMHLRVMRASQVYSELSGISSKTNFSSATCGQKCSLILKDDLV